MRYPRHLLTDDEVVVREFHPHWRVLLGPGMLALIAVAAVVVAWTTFGDRTGIAWGLTAGAGLLIVGWVLPGWLRWAFTLYVLTTERVIVRTGIVSRQGLELPLENINDVRFSQRVVERMLGYGDVTLESAGERGQSVLTDIPHPERFQSQVYAIREDRSVAMSGGPAVADPVAQLEALARLRDQGAITEEEFAAKKAQLLERM